MGGSVPKHTGPNSLTDTHPRTERLQNLTDHHQRESPEMEKPVPREAQAACRFNCWASKSTLQKLRCRSFDDLESEIGGFALEIVNLQFAVLGVVKLRSLVDEWHAVAQHAIDQSSQLGRHSLNGNGSPELSSQSTELRSKIGIA